MDIISLPIKFDKTKIDGTYRLVMAAVKRAKDLSQGSLPIIASKAQKITTLAIEEVASGAVKIIKGKEAVQAIEDAKKEVHQKVIDEAQQKETMPEDMTELEKDLKELEIAHEKYFLGTEKRAPEQQRQKFTLRMRKMITHYIPQTDLRYRLQGISSRYNSYCGYWDRIQRQIDEGRYERHTSRIQRFAQTAASTPSASTLSAWTLSWVVPAASGFPPLLRSSESPLRVARSRSRSWSARRRKPSISSRLASTWRKIRPLSFVVG